MTQSKTERSHDIAYLLYIILGRKLDENEILANKYFKEKVLNPLSVHSLSLPWDEDVIEKPIERDAKKVFCPMKPETLPPTFLLRIEQLKQD